MSMELFVLSDRQLNSIEQWQQAISAEGFPLRLSTETLFRDLDGILPVHLGERRTDFECSHWNADELMKEDYPEIDFRHNWAHCLSFRWGGSDLYSLPAAWMAASAYARVTVGVVFDPQQGDVLTPQRAVDLARGSEQEIPAIEEAIARALKEQANQTERKDQRKEPSSESSKIRAYRRN
jgi:hypothetical protein